MAQTSSGLQRSAISFRRQGSSGLVWDDRFVSGEIPRPKDTSKPRFYSQELALPNKPQQQQQRSRVGGRAHAYDDLDINTDVGIRPIKTVRSKNQSDQGGEPPSPRLKGCGCCSGFVRTPRSSRTARSTRSRAR